MLKEDPLGILFYYAALTCSRAPQLADFLRTSLRFGRWFDEAFRVRSAALFTAVFFCAARAHSAFNAASVYKSSRFVFNKTILVRSGSSQLAFLVGMGFFRIFFSFDFA